MIHIWGPLEERGGGGELRQKWDVIGVGGGAGVASVLDVQSFFY